MLIIFNPSVDLIDFLKEVSLNTSDVTKFTFSNPYPSQITE
jgi:hypothetical protein